MSLKSDLIYFQQTYDRSPTSDELQEMKNKINVSEKNVNMYQIVLTTDKQKMVFAFNTTNHLKTDSFCKLLKEATNCDHTVIQSDNMVEITFNNKLFDNKSDADKYVEYLKDEISKLNPEYGDLMSTIKPILLHHGTKCSSHNVNNILIDRPTDEQLAKILKTTLNVNSLIINYGTVNVGHIGNNKISNKDVLEAWLQNNPIDEKILQVDYRQKFLDDTNVKIHPNTFGKMASKYIKSVTCSGKTYYLNK